mmetsp:Transcript_1435/g.2191  ORF Transcript_1435/g.2191 Transcript_1435/m.2191 type:complete len:520 (+) Transcript_1435:133-1692(+)|eukprot:CAMPEP_0184673434 /NCGR_PEP_ID=MMETSP0308-20130426/86675_1 /TAXON_ID=38269 /ORGANISM="Gloeochaete witrockiana, Strain SAG 46.84" /LENGTH=519 /DNA_ID=CAMNT_0027120915 /DNA_START=130 /DNA_END=1689 /DNA_ORIENTATION=-
MTNVNGFPRLSSAIESGYGLLQLASAAAPYSAAPTDHTQRFFEIWDWFLKEYPITKHLPPSIVWVEFCRRCGYELIPLQKELVKHMSELLALHSLGFTPDLVSQCLGIVIDIAQALTPECGVPMRPFQDAASAIITVPPPLKEQTPTGTPATKQTAEDYVPDLEHPSRSVPSSSDDDDDYSDPPKRKKRKRRKVCVEGDTALSKRRKSAVSPRDRPSSNAAPPTPSSGGPLADDHMHKKDDQASVVTNDSTKSTDSPSSRKPNRTSVKFASPQGEEEWSGGKSYANELARRANGEQRMYSVECFFPCVVMHSSETLRSEECVVPKAEKSPLVAFYEDAVSNSASWSAASRRLMNGILNNCDASLRGKVPVYAECRYLNPYRRSDMTVLKRRFAKLERSGLLTMTRKQFVERLMALPGESPLTVNQEATDLEKEEGANQVKEFVEGITDDGASSSTNHESLSQDSQPSTNGVDAKVALAKDESRANGEAVSEPLSEQSKQGSSVSEPSVTNHLPLKEEPP